MDMFVLIKSYALLVSLRPLRFIEVPLILKLLPCVVSSCRM